MKRVFLTGFCRSGTMSIAQFFQKFGIKSYHQKSDPQAGNMTPYDFRKPPSWAADYIKRKAAGIKGSDIAFESSWGIAHYLYGMSLNIPSAKFLIMVREPVSACNSIRALGHKRHPQDIDELALLYNMTFLSLLWQSSIMVNKPQWMDFDNYTRGEYTSALFGLFGVPETASNILAAKKHLNEKVNTSGPYRETWSEHFKLGRILAANLKIMIGEFSE